MPTPRSIVLASRPTDYQKQHSIVQDGDGSVSFAPINRFALTIPLELTSKIFLHCLPDSEFICSDAYSAPLLLCHICRQWRHIAVNTPGLWASLAGKMPLSLQMDEGPGYHIAKGLEIHEDQLLPVYLVPVGAEFPQLIKLSVDLATECGYEEYYPGSFPPGYIFPGYAPYVLKDARSLREIQFYRAPWTLTIPEKMLEIYGSEKVNVPECVDVLRSATGHSSCIFGLIPHVQQTSVTSLPPLVHLQVLTLSERAEDIRRPLLIMDLLRYLTLPSLKHLTLEFEETKDRLFADISQLTHFASRSSLQLEKLTLCFLPTSKTTLLQFLQCMQSITVLELQLRTSINGVLR
ncbi:hypothetical protein B0H19DRAFT_1251447 [Mycena capillaripes]|nr:hypothetical protein B0H19DRAFT_1251447 [Mycena capillaripes]